MYKLMLCLVIVLSFNSVMAVSLLFTKSGGNTTADVVTATYGTLNLTMGTIAGVAGQQIMISKVGIGGDSRAASGDNIFSASCGSFNFSWVAGQQTNTATYRLSPTTPSGSSYGFTYQAVSYTANVGEAVTITWVYHNDWDGCFASGTDILGNSYNDTASSVRVWVQYEYIGTVPEPATWMLLVLPILAWIGYRGRK